MHKKTKNMNFTLNGGYQCSWPSPQRQRVRSGYILPFPDPTRGFCILLNCLTRVGQFLITLMKQLEGASNQTCQVGRVGLDLTWSFKASVHGFRGQSVKAQLKKLGELGHFEIWSERPGPLSKFIGPGEVMLSGLNFVCLVIILL